MQTDVGQLASVVSSQSAARHPVVQAVTDLARPHSSMLDHVAARGRLREALTSYVRTLRAEGATPTDVLAVTNALARRALSGIAPTRLASDIRDAIRRWALAAYDRVD